MCISYAYTHSMCNVTMRYALHDHERQLNKKSNKNKNENMCVYIDIQGARPAAGYLRSGLRSGPTTPIPHFAENPRRDLVRLTWYMQVLVLSFCLCCLYVTCERVLVQNTIHADRCALSEALVLCVFNEGFLGLGLASSENLSYQITLVPYQFTLVLY